MVTSKPPDIHPLLGDLSSVPPDYIRAVSSAKRFLERWTMDPRYRDSFDADPQQALASLDLPLTPDEVIPLINRDAAQAATEALLAGRHQEVPATVIRYRAFIKEKIDHRRSVRTEIIPADARLAAWRERQIHRCQGELGEARSDAIVHAPVAIELAKGCTVGCWFCGVDAAKFEQTWPYSGHEEQWRGVLTVLREVLGPCAGHGFLYWATDPLDNPGYEHFIRDFRAILGRCPQTTTAQGQKDIERTRNLLRLAQSLDSVVDRFSVLALNSLSRIHEGFSAEELLRVECVPQNRESADRHRKSNAGRARKFSKKRGNELVSEEDSSTIACVSGFLLNMVDRSVSLITPCNVTERWPLGYWVVDSAHFGTPDDLRAVMAAMIGKLRTSLRVTDVVRLRPDVTAEADGDRVRVTSRGLGLSFSHQPQADELAKMLTDGSATVQEIALARNQRAGVPLAVTLSLLDEAFDHGLFDEEPAAAEPGPAGHTVDLELTTSTR